MAVAALRLAHTSPNTNSHPITKPPSLPLPHPAVGGIYGYPGDAQNPNGKLRLQYECAPMSMICEQVGAGCRCG